jgi:hypothetical protein
MKPLDECSMATPAPKKRKTSLTRSEEAAMGDAIGGTLGKSIGEEDKTTAGLRDTHEKTPKEAKKRPSSLPNGVYSSSLFQLQTDELLIKVRPDYDRRMIKAENALRKLKEVILRIPNHDPKSVCPLPEIDVRPI